MNTILNWTVDPYYTAGIWEMSFSWIWWREGVIEQMDKRVKGKEMRICTVAQHYTAVKDKFQEEQNNGGTKDLVIL